MARFCILVASLFVLGYAAQESSQTVSDEAYTAVQLVKSNFENLISTPEIQQFIAAIALAFGGAAVYDGRYCFKQIIIILLVGVSYCFSLVLLEASTEGELPLLAKYATALEISLSVGWAAYVGWNGGQLLLGLAGGVWLFKGVDVIMSIIISDFHLKIDVHENNAYLVATRTLCLAFGLLAVHESGGGKRFFGLIAPIFGSSLVVAGCGYTFLFVVSKCAPLQTAFSVHIETDAVPAVWEYWLMMVHPVTSKAVGLFTLKGDDFTVHNHIVQPDRVIALSLWFLIAVIGIQFQCKSDSSITNQQVATMQRPLLAKAAK